MTAIALRSTRGAIAIARCAMVAGVLLAAIAFFDLRQQFLVWQAEQVLAGVDAAIARGDIAAVRSFVAGVDDLDRNLPPRAAVYRALALASNASVSPAGAARTHQLAIARAEINLAMASRPDWGEAQLTSAYIGLISNGRQPTPLVLKDFAASYRNTAFLRDAARWRAGAGLALWPQLDPATRTRVIDEAVLLARLSPGDRPAMFDAARRSGGYFDFAKVWLDTRRDDADLKRQPPT